MRTGYESYVRPRRRPRAYRRTRCGRRRPERTLGNAIGSVLSIGDIANDTRVRRALERVSPRSAVVQQKKGPASGTYLAIGAGIVAAAGVAYAVWQTFRADDELWVADDEPRLVRAPSSGDHAVAGDLTPRSLEGPVPIGRAGAFAVRAYSRGPRLTVLAPALVSR